MSVWCVWIESGEYEQYSRDLRGIFANQTLAEAHAAHLGGGEVVEEDVLEALPVEVPYVRYAAHILPDGTEDMGLGYHRGSEYSTWSNELGPLDHSRVDDWNARRQPEDKYIEVVGSDEGLVAAEYARLLRDLRESASRLSRPAVADSDEKAR